MHLTAERVVCQICKQAKDRLRAEHDYRVNLKAELEIRHILAKLDIFICQKTARSWLNCLRRSSVWRQAPIRCWTQTGRQSLSTPARMTIQQPQPETPVRRLLVE